MKKIRIIIFVLLSGYICFILKKYLVIQPTTIIYSTDIALDGDFDDYFDLIVIKSLDNIDLNIIIDGNDVEQKQSGYNAIKNLQYTGGGNKEPIFFGRDDNLLSLQDNNIDNHLLEVLKKARGKVDIVTVGSLRDIASLYNNATDLFEDKVNKLWIFAGDAEGTIKEYNVGLDELAFLRIMNSGKLNIFWIPCFQNGIWTKGANTSYFTVTHSEIFENVDSDLLKWFMYRYEKSNIDFLDYELDEHNISQFMNEVRNIWCAPLFPLINDSMTYWLNRYNEECRRNISLPFGFEKKKVTFLKGGVVEYGKGNEINVFKVYNNEDYEDFSIFLLKCIFSEFYNK